MEAAMMIVDTKAPASGGPAGARRTARERPSDQIVALEDREQQAPSLIFLDEDEIVAVIEALLSTNGLSTEDEIVKVVSWANRVRCEDALLGLILKDRLGIRLDDDELVFVTRGQPEGGGE
jgi:vacuolar-type H+-ATPase subunit B/Vma2